MLTFRFPKNLILMGLAKTKTKILLLDSVVLMIYDGRLNVVPAGRAGPVGWKNLEVNISTKSISESLGIIKYFFWRIWNFQKSQFSFCRISENQKSRLVNFPLTTKSTPVDTHQTKTKILCLAQHTQKIVDQRSDRYSSYSYFFWNPRTPRVLSKWRWDGSSAGWVSSLYVLMQFRGAKWGSSEWTRRLRRGHEREQIAWLTWDE